MSRYLLPTVIVLTILTLFPHRSDAAVIIQRPFYIGLSNGLVGYWSLDGGDISNTRAFDRSGQGNDGTLTNGPTRVKGKLGQGMSFDGTNDYVSAGNGSSLDLTSAMSVAFWFRKDTHVDNWQIAVSKEEAYQVMTGGNPGAGFSNNKPQLALFIGGAWARVETVSSVSANTWYHIIATYDGSTMRLYLNGALDNSSSQTGNIATNANNLELGAGFTGCGGCYHRGTLDDVRIYNRALSADEVKRLYKIGGTFTVGKAPTPGSGAANTLNNGLVGYWSFDGPDMNATEAFDRSGQGNDGTLTNGPKLAKGKLGQGLEFDGVDDYIDAGDQTSHEPSDAITACGWIKYAHATAENDATILAKEYTAGVSPFVSYGLKAGGDAGGVSDYLPSFLVAISGTIRFNQTSPTTLVRSVWYHLCGTWSTGNELRLYVNGKLDSVSAATYSGTISYNNGKNLHIGREAAFGGSASYFKGTIDDVRIYNRALSADEVKRLYNMGHIN